MPIQRLAIGICAAVALLTGLAVAVFLHNHRAVVYEAFVERSTTYVATFANVAAAWLRNDDAEMVETTARFLLLGSVFYVQVVAEATVLIDERSQESDALDLVLSPVDSDDLSVGQRRLGDGPRFLDVVIPTTLETNSDQGPVSGYVRIGVDASTVEERIRSATLITAGAGVAFDGLIIGFVLWLIRHIQKKEARRDRTNPTATESTVVVHGALRIDETTKHVSLYGRHVHLPPKQYTLLCLLASDAGRVFSDREIVVALWPSSRYANSKDVKQQVYLLRRRLAAGYCEGSELIVNVPGFGYKLVPPTVDEDLTGS